MHNIIDETMISQLREKVASILSPGRVQHTLGVERMVVEIGKELALDLDDVNKLSAAALLHDITKEYSFEKQLKICNEFGIILKDDEISCPPILHAITAAAIIPLEYSYFDTPEVISAVRWHTTGRQNMSVYEKIICLSDHIEDGRRYESCVKIRNEFWSDIKSCRNIEDKHICLNKALKKSLEATIEHIKSKGGIINQDTAHAINSIS